LVVEDDDRLRRVISRNLEARGYLVLEARTFREAISQLAIKPALLILDIHLPDASGWEVAGWIESMTEPMPIVVISGLPPDARRVKHYHPTAFLPKPFAIGELLDVVKAQVPTPVSALGA